MRRTARKDGRGAILAACGALLAAAVLATAGGGAADAAFVDPGNVQTTFASVAPERLDFAGVDAGDDYSLGWTSDGRLYAWGANVRGQLGVGDFAPRSIPTAVPFPPGVAIAEASAGVNMSVAVTTTGDVYTWGNSDVAPSEVNPGLIPSLSGQGVIGVSAGGFYFLAWTSSGQLYSWGNNGGGRLGWGGTTSQATPGRVTAQSLNTRFVTTASAGRFFGLASVAGGTALVGWGTSYGSAAGTTFTGIPGTTTVAGVSAGNAFTFAWTADGRLYSGSTTNALTQDTRFTGITVIGAEVSVPSAGASSFYVWNSLRQLYSWGLNSSGQLGLGDNADRAAPVQVTLPPGAQVAGLGAGSTHALFIGTNGDFSAAGSNGSGQLGTGDTVSRNTFSAPVLVERWP